MAGARQGQIVEGHPAEVGGAIRLCLSGLRQDCSDTTCRLHPGTPHPVHFSLSPVEIAAASPVVSLPPASSLSITLPCLHALLSLCSHLIASLADPGLNSRASKVPTGHPDLFLPEPGQAESGTTALPVCASLPFLPALPPFRISAGAPPHPPSPVPPEVGGSFPQQWSPQLCRSC